LIALAKRRMSTNLARRVDPEDVVQSAYRSFCAADSDRFVLQRSGDLWRLLAGITLHKLQHQIRRHNALKRSIKNEQAFGDENSFDHFKTTAETREPPPDEAITMAEELEHLLRGLKPLDRKIVSLRLEGYHIEEIATVVERSERWVRRVLSVAKELLDKRREEFAAE